MSLLFNTLPATARVAPTPFQVAFPKDQLVELETLIKLSKLAPPTFENSQSNTQYGVTKDWLVAMKEQWLRSYKWYICSLSRPRDMIAFSPPRTPADNDNYHEGNHPKSESIAFLNGQLKLKT